MNKESFLGRVFNKIKTPVQIALFSVVLPTLSLIEKPSEPIDPPLAGKTICLDPGHDDIYVPGATARDWDGQIIYREQDLTLEVAKRLRTKLEEAGAEVCMTRDEEGKVQLEPEDINGNGSVVRAEDVVERTQNRIDYLNQFNPDIILSIHFNGHNNPSLKGTETYYSNTGIYEDNNRLFAENIQSFLVGALNENNYYSTDRGIKSDNYRSDYIPFTSWYGFDRSCTDCSRLITLGNNPMSPRGGIWKAGALVETLFFSNPYDVEFLKREDAPDIITEGFYNGISNYVQQAGN